MVVFLDRYEETDDILIETLEKIEPIEYTYVLKDMPFLPQGVMSIYEYYIAKHEKSILKEKDLYYAFLKSPEFWQVKADGMHGAIYDMEQKKATIYVRFPYEKRYIERVEWLAESGNVYRIDYYNRYGYAYCRAFFNQEGDIESKAYYTSLNEEVLHINYSNGVVTLFKNGYVCEILPSLEAFEMKMLKEMKAESNTIVLTSASQIQKVMNLKMKESCSSLLAMRHEEDVRFCQENQIQNLLKTSLLIFSNTDTVMCNADENYGEYRICYVADSYPQMKGNADALILTTSDVLYGIETLVELLPKVKFHIAANTMVSQKLIDLSQRENVCVYPQIGGKKLEELLEMCDYYLDINAGRELYHAIIRASINSMLILGYSNTLHNPDYLLEECIFKENETEKLAEKWQMLIQSEEERKRLITKQQGKAMESIRKIVR